MVGNTDIKKWIKIGALVGTALLIISLGIFCLRMKRRKDAHQGTYQSFYSSISELYFKHLILLRS